MMEALRRDTKDIIGRVAENPVDYRNRMALRWLLKATDKSLKNKAILSSINSGNPTYIQKVPLVYSLISGTEYNKTEQTQQIIKIANAKQLYEQITGIKLPDISDSQS